MPHPDHSALQNSDLNPFLFAAVGTELNGSTLTMLSVLARLGRDPWVEAGSWAKLPKSIAVERLISAIRDIPLSSRSAAETKTVASQLVMLLPAPEGLVSFKAPALPDKITARAFDLSLGVRNMPRWLPMALLALALLLGISLHVIRAPGGGGNSSPITQTKAQAPAASESH